MTQALDRRQFLIRLAKTGLAMAAAGGIGWWFHDPDGPAGEGALPETVRLSDFSLAGARGLGIVRGVKPAGRARAVEMAVKALGGMERFVGPGDRVLLKVNAAFASPPALGATTHPDLVAAVARLCLAAGAESVAVTDNPINDPISCFELSGIARAAREAGAGLLLPRADGFRPATLEGGRLIQNWPILYEPFRGITRLIGLAPVKDHHRSGASLTMKNWYGVLGGRRNLFHQEVHTIIQELALLVRPTLVILDGTVSMMQNGPTGGSLSDLKETGTLIVSTDPVAADTLGARLLGKTAADLPFIHKAEAAGAGTSDLEALSPRELGVDG